MKRAALLAASIVGTLSAGCNFIVGVGDYSSGTASDGSIAAEGGHGEGSDAATDTASGDDATAGDDGPGVAEGGPGDGGVDSGGPDAASDAPRDAPTDSSNAALDAGLCMPSSLVACSAGNGVGYVCQGTHDPEETHPSWDCGSPVSTSSTTSSYCCWTCYTDSTVTGCLGSASRYTCDDVDTPAADYGDTCQAATNSGSGSHGFCCSSITPSACTTNYDCSGTDAVCGPAGKCVLATGAIGDPCSSAGDCTGASETCNGKWCTTSSCSSSASCGTATNGLANQCVPRTSGGNGCFPSCSSNNDCYPYSGTFCMTGTTAYGVCSVTPGGLGDPCDFDSDCLGSALCDDEYACSPGCSSASDTSCGTNTAGYVNRCVYDSTWSQYECYAGCASNADCVAYGGGTCTTVTGGNVCVP